MRVLLLPLPDSALAVMNYVQPQDLRHRCCVLSASSLTIRAVCSAELGAACDSLAEDMFDSEFVVGSGKSRSFQLAGGLSP